MAIVGRAYHSKSLDDRHGVTRTIRHIGWLSWCAARILWIMHGLRVLGTSDGNGP
jgi:hypothetical protein